MESCGCNRWPSLQGRSSQKRQRRMEPLWSPVVATGGNQRQIRSARNPPKQAKSVAVGCHRLPEKFHGKEGSTVRVRQRALRKPCVARLFLLITNHSLSRTIGGVDAWCSAF